MNNELMEAHRDQARAAKAEGRVCHHGNALGSSSWDVPFCGACEHEQDDEIVLISELPEEEQFRIDALSIMEEERANQEDMWGLPF